MAHIDRDGRSGGDPAWRLADGRPAIIRAPHAGDEEALSAFHRDLSERSVFLRYFSVAPVEHRVDGLHLTDERDLSLVAETTLADGSRIIIGIGALVPTGDGRSAEMAVLVADAYQGLGLGAEVLRRLLAVARRRQMRSVAGEMLPENEAMVALARRLGFTLTTAPDDARIVRATLEL